MRGPRELGSLRWIPKGYHGTQKTIEEMRRLVDSGKTNMRIITWASDIVKDVPERDPWGENAAIFKWIQRHIKFRNDPSQVELLQGPLVTLERRAGDCDDLSVLMNSAAAALGYNTAFKTIKAEPRSPDEFSHVYSLIALPIAGTDRWIPADTSQKDQRFGWEPPGEFGSQIWGYSRGRLTKRELPPSLKGLGVPPNNNLKSVITDWISGKLKRTKRPRETTVMQTTDAQGPVNILLPDQADLPTAQQDEWEYERRYYYGNRGGHGGGRYNTTFVDPIIETGGVDDGEPSKVVIRPLLKKDSRRDIATKFDKLSVPEGYGTDIVKIYPTEEPTGGHFEHFTDQDDALAEAGNITEDGPPDIDFEALGIDI